MEKYLTIITTVLVVTQVIRITQNTLSLYRQNKLIKAQLNEIGELTDDDLKRKIAVDKLLIEVLPKILERYEEADVMPKNCNECECTSTCQSHYGGLGCKKWNEHRE